MGIEFRLNVNVGVDISFEKLSKEYDAVFLGLGTYTDMTGGFEHEDANSVYTALDFLVGNTQKLMGITENAKEYVNFDSQKVIVLGGGDTAMDCVRTSIRQGASQVTCAYRRDEANMPGSPREVQNAKEEGVNFEFNIQPIDIATGDSKEGKGKAIGVRFVRTQLGIADAKGRGNPEPIEASEFVMEADAIVIVFGLLPSPPQWMVDAGVKLDSRGRVVAVDNSDFALQTSEKISLLVVIWYLAQI